MGFGSVWHWVIVLVIVLLLFGSGKISNIMGDMAKGIKAFKKGMKDDDAEDHAAAKTIEGAAAPAAKEKDRATT